MSEPWNCSVCGQNCLTQTCMGCGAKQGEGGGNPLGIIAWMFVFFLIPIYPIAGGLASLALMIVAKTAGYLDVPSIGQFILIAIATYATLFLTFKYEQGASQLRWYRNLRSFLRLLAGVLMVVWALNSKNSATPADAAFIALFGVPIGYFVLKRLDKVFGTAGPPKVAKAGKFVAVDGDATPGFWSSLNWHTAMAYGSILSLFGFIFGRDAQLFTVALLWIVITGGIIGVQIAGRLLGMSGRLTSGANSKLGHVPGALLYGLGIGAVTGAMLGKVIDGRVQIEAVIIAAVVGVVVALVVNRLRARSRAANASEN